MGRIIKIFKTLRNHWKKSTFAVCLVSYGVKFGKDTYDTHQLMRRYCELACTYGDQPIPVTKPLRQITVILNPAANKRKAKNLFDKYCAPLLYCAGLAVTVIQTEYVGQAKELLEKLDPKTDAVVIAGGDGTLSETVTGLLRRAEDDSEKVRKLPIGVLPLGQTNLVARALLNEKQQVQSLIDATMAVIDGELRPVDVMKIQPIQEEDSEVLPKPVYSLARIEWGSFRDARSNRDKYWYFGPLRIYASYLFSSPECGTWNICYSEPCAGCSKCFVKKKESSNKRWWQVFVPRSSMPQIDYSKITNDNCGQLTTRDISVVEFQINTSTILKDSETSVPKLHVGVGPSDVSWTGFVSEGWHRVKNVMEIKPVEEIPVKEIYLKPEANKEDAWLSIDSEDFEVKSMKVSILPKTVSLFHPKQKELLPLVNK